MKKMISVLLAAAMLCCLSVSLAGCGSSDTLTLNVYNWGEYISDGSEGSFDTIHEFERWYEENYGQKLKVNYDTYASNEDMYNKISSGAVSYDVIIPSDYMIARMANEGMLLPLNFDNIPNYQYIEDSFRGLYYDPDDQYSVPYTYGVVGVIYNANVVDEADISGWELMWNDKYSGNILQFNNSRDAFATAQYKLGLDVNSTDKAVWDQAYQEMLTQRPLVYSYVMDEIFNKMKGGIAAVAPYYAGDFFTMYADNEDLDFFYPEEGTNVFVDVMCIPSSTKNFDLAKEYINFMLTEEIAVANAEYVCYAWPNTLVKDNEEYIEYMTEEVHPDAISILYNFDMSNMEFFYDLPDDTRAIMNSLWEDLKIESNIGIAIYIICAVIIVALISIFTVRLVIKRRRKYYFDKYSVN